MVVALIGVAAFFAGSRSVGRGDDSAGSQPDEVRRAGATKLNDRDHAPRDLRSHASGDRGEMSGMSAAKMTPEERLSLLNKAALMSDPSKQAKVLCGLISAMTKEELDEATGRLLHVQSRGNAWSQDVWNALWTQWGRVDPEGCLARSAMGNGLNTGNDYRCMIVGWMESDPQAAMEWAQRPKHGDREAIAAAYAIISSTDGDLQKMEGAIMEMAANPEVAAQCLHDYFDVLLAGSSDPSLTSVYEGLDPTLQEAAWPVMMKRLTYMDVEVAATWLEAHASDPGWNYEAMGPLIRRLCDDDLARASELITRLPMPAADDRDALREHPGMYAVGMWLGKEPAAAKAWLSRQPVDTPWVRGYGYTLRAE